MKVGDLVDDTRCRSPRLGKAGLILSVVGDMAWVRWPSSPHFPLWAPMKVLKRSGHGEAGPLLAYSSDPF